VGKIVRFKTPQDDIVAALEDILQRAKDGQMTGFVFAAKCPGGEVATSWAQTDVGDRNELVSHLQIDVMYAVMAANMDKLVEFI
jgi:hypothetical protein